MPARRRPARNIHASDILSFVRGGSGSWGPCVGGSQMPIIWSRKLAKPIYLKDGRAVTTLARHANFGNAQRRGREI